MNTKQSNILYFSITDINECLANNGVGDCLNGATCNKNDGSFTCKCAPGWTGDRCAVGKISKQSMTKLIEDRRQITDG